jgi:hypothetical protein
MAQTKINCEDCDCTFYIVFDPDECQDEPNFCPFCASGLLDCDFSNDEEEL